jgi:hypothetical protein
MSPTSIPDGTNHTYFTGEIRKEQTRCSNIESTKDSNPYDNRYTKVEGLSISEYNLYNQSGLYNIFN